MMKRLLISIPLLSVLIIALISASNAYFTDSEISNANTFEAGTIDLTVGNTSYYNGQASPLTSWEPSGLTLKKFFDFSDIKPGDTGEDTISLTVSTNDAWGCADVTVTSDNENTATDQELAVGDTADDTENGFDGELAKEINFVFWNDDGDNVLETEENILYTGPISSLIPGTRSITLADSETNVLGELNGTPMLGLKKYYIGKAWCFGSLSQTPIPQDGFNNRISPITGQGAGITCDGSQLNNITQTDIVTADIAFRAVQARHNTGYLCAGTPTPTITPTITLTPTVSPSITPSVTPTPTTLVCTSEWASGVVSSAQGLRKDNTPVLAERSNTSDVLGLAQSSGLPFDNPPPSGFYSLGFGGSIVVSFTTPVPNAAGNGFKIFEVTGGTSYPAEIIKVEGSTDGSSWTVLSAGITRDGTFTLGSLPYAKYLKLTDISDVSLFESTADAYDLDAIQSLCGTIPN